MAGRNAAQKNGGEKGTLTQWERLQLSRLACALILFLAVFLGKQIYPNKMIAVGEDIIAVLGRTTEVESVFAKLGEAIAEEEALSGLEEFCTTVFGVSQNHTEEKAEVAVLCPVYPAVHAGLLNEELNKLFFAQQKQEMKPTTEEELAQPPAVGTVIRTGPATDTPIPSGYTMDELSFGSLETVSPVLGNLNSGFGYREHPISGKTVFHRGADINASEGDPIVSFADGVVEYIGQDNTYGLYMQIDHGNEIKSFYAHCSQVCVKYGQQVTAGEMIAKVGSTGRVTGPHLHLELKCCGKRVDPAYYVDFI